jgi:hypothetical protein
MRRNTFSATNIIADLNNIKKAMMIREGGFKYNDLRKAFTNAGLPSNNTFWTAFYNANLIKSIGGGKYKFTDTEPIYVGTIEHIHSIYKHKQQEYSKNAYEKKKEKKQSKEKMEEKQITTEELNKVLDEKTQEAINHLKSLGFKILRPQRIIYSEM